MIDLDSVEAVVKGLLRKFGPSVRATNTLGEVKELIDLAKQARQLSPEWLAIDAAPTDTPVILASSDGRVGEGVLYIVKEASKRPSDNVGDLRGIFLQGDSWGGHYCIPVKWLPMPSSPIENS